nr:EOG090X049L [Sida crystallina]
MNVKRVLFLFVISFFLAAQCLIASVEAAWDPYSILGLTRSASTQDIRKAYKQYAKEWHPDKNKNENAEAKFVEINKAYEASLSLFHFVKLMTDLRLLWQILSDPARRKMYDQRGLVEDGPNFKSGQSSGDHFGEMPSFFSHSGGFKFQFKMPEMSFYYQQSITLKAYENTVLPQSQKQPYLVMVYSEWCMMCLHVLPLWQRLVEELEPIGINLVTVHYDHETDLAQKLGGRRGELPHLVLVMDSRITYFNEDQFSVIKVIEFMRSRFPRNLISAVNDENGDELLQGWKDNKVRVFLFGKLELVRLRYLALAFRYRSNAIFGYVQLNQESTVKLRERFGVPVNLDSLLLFHEDNKRPVARLSMADLPFSTMKDVIDANKYLQLPRLSSQSMLDSLCPPEMSNARRRLCAILVTEDRAEDDEARDQLRQFTRQFKFSRERVTFTYIFRDKQNEFLSSLTQDGVSPREPQSHVVIVWRQDIHRLSYSWLSQPFVPGADHWNTSKEHLQTTLVELMGASQPLPYQTVMKVVIELFSVSKELVDEHALGIISRITNRIASAAEVLRDHVKRQDLLAVGSVIGTVLFIAAVGYVMTYLVRLEEETIQKQKQDRSARGSRSSTGSTTSELKLHELRTETFNGMVRLLKPGCRTVVLLVDNSSKLTLIPKFHKAVWPYRKIVVEINQWIIGIQCYRFDFAETSSEMMSMYRYSRL